MYKYISREDCYYTDTDSIVLGNPLPPEDVSSSVLGKFKLEEKLVRAYFLAPKCYCYATEESEGNNKVLKFKGAGRSVITPEWFEEQYADPSRSLTEKVTYPFRPDWKELEVIKKEGTITLRTVSNNKRKSLFDENGKWVGTDPLDINDLSCLNYIGTKLFLNLKRKNYLLENENSALSLKLVQLEQERGIIVPREVESRKKPEDQNTLEDKKTLEEKLERYERRLRMKDVYNTLEVEDAQQKGEDKDETPDIVEKSDQPENPEKPHIVEKPETPDPPENTEKPNKPDPPENTEKPNKPDPPDLDLKQEQENTKIIKL
jgi:hypothetical protein